MFGIRLESNRTVFVGTRERKRGSSLDVVFGRSTAAVKLNATPGVVLCYRCRIGEQYKKKKKKKEDK